MGKNGRVAHECIIERVHSTGVYGVTVDGIAKRVTSGFYRPTTTWPVPGTLMIEPTETVGFADCATQTRKVS